MAALAGVALGDSDQTFKGGAGIQVHRGHQAPLFKSLAEHYSQPAEWPWLRRWLSAWPCSGDSAPATTSPPRKPFS
ncbi:hypothetical protein PSEUDO8Z_250007 [Pseudomonas sp. 8Z]|nr:hypothetical protein PSEUDO8Z_250007 [Pseudomonas sp. 8Z]